MPEFDSILLLKAYFKTEKHVSAMSLPTVKSKSPGQFFSSSHYLPHHAKKPQTQTQSKCSLMQYVTQRADLCLSQEFFFLTFRMNQVF